MNYSRTIHWRWVNIYRVLVYISFRAPRMWKSVYRFPFSRHYAASQTVSNVSQRSATCIFRVAEHGGSSFLRKLWDSKHFVRRGINVYFGYCARERKTPRHPVSEATNFWKVPPNICGFSVCNLLHITTLAPRILRLLRNPSVHTA